MLEILYNTKQAQVTLVNPGTPEYRNTYKKTFLVTYL